MKNFLFVVIGTLFLLPALQAQRLLRPFDAINRSKPSYIVLEDGTEITGEVGGVDRKKGLIEEIKIKTANGKEVIPTENIKYAYFPQNGFDKLMKTLDFFEDATQWNRGMYDADRIKDGYALFEKSPVQRKKKEFTALLQLLNPHGCTDIKVYHDPLASETAGMAVGGVQVTGGKDKSYFVSVKGGQAFRLEKKNYKDNFPLLFGKCKHMKKTYGKAKWSEFEEAIFNYESNCVN